MVIGEGKKEGVQVVTNRHGIDCVFLLLRATQLISYFANLVGNLEWPKISLLRFTQKWASDRDLATWSQTNIDSFTNIEMEVMSGGVSPMLH